MQWPQALGTFESLKVCARSLAHSLNTSSIRLASIGLFWFQGTPLHRLVTQLDRWLPSLGSVPELTIHTRAALLGQLGDIAQV